MYAMTVYGGYEPTVYHYETVTDFATAIMSMTSDRALEVSVSWADAT